MAKIPVSVCIIAKNEEQHIGECLKHLRKYDMEIIVADTGSTDRTKEIAAKYADKVVDFAWVDDFAAARNYCASMAKNNWILAIDCDEYVTGMDAAALRILTQKFPRHIGMLRLKNLVPYGGGQKGYVTDDVPRLYNKNYYQFRFPIHEQLRFIDPARSEDALDVFLIPMEVVHHGYVLTDEEMEQKQRRNLALLNKALEKDPSNGYHYFQIGQSNFVLGNLDAAITAYETGMRLFDQPEKLYVAEMIMSLAKAYSRKGRFSDALSLLEQYTGLYNTAKFQYEYANVLMENNQILKALMLYIKVTTMKDCDTLGEHLMACYGRIMDIYKGMGNEEMAEVFRGKYLKCAEERERVLNS